VQARLPPTKCCGQALGRAEKQWYDGTARETQRPPPAALAASPVPLVDVGGGAGAPERATTLVEVRSIFRWPTNLNIFLRREIANFSNQKHGNNNRRAQQGRGCRRSRGAAEKRHPGAHLGSSLREGRAAALPGPAPSSRLALAGNLCFSGLCPRSPRRDAPCRTSSGVSWGMVQPCSPWPLAGEQPPACLVPPRSGRERDAANGGPKPPLTCSLPCRQHDELLLSASKDCTCRMWDLEYATCVRTITGHSDAVRSVVFSLDDRLIFTGGDTCVRVWDRNSPREIACFRGHHGHVTAVDVQMRQLGSISYGLSMISSSYDCSTKVWDLRCKMAVRTCIGHQKPITCNTIMPDGKTVISGSLDAQCRFYDASSVAANVPWSLANPMGQARQIRVLKIAKNAISRVRLSPDNKWLASSSLDGNVGITRIGPDTTTQLKGHAAAQGACDCAWHSSNASIATAGGRDIIIWDIGYLLDQDDSKSRPITQQDSRAGSSGASPGNARADRAAEWPLVAYGLLRMTYGV